ncbi:beta-1,3-galactosyltransferase 1-like [Antedon mediterranea]|uniref:beta-1,3-galactosyltransferase 1-like n=1 Tax=Antedon mediterranea TaxID=105859 RepID=UPI003AF48B27
MRCSRNCKLYTFYGLAAFNLVVLLLTHVIHPIDNAKSISDILRGKKLSSFHSNLKIYKPVLVTNISETSNVLTFDRFNLFPNKSNDYPIFPQFNLLLNPKDKCQNDDIVNKSSGIFLLVLVTSSRRNIQQRKVVRKTWASVESIEGKKIITLFMLGVKVGGGPSIMDPVMAESEKYGDIILGDFNDAYMNLTLKSIMGFKWTSMYCSSAKYVMKTDDDMFINLNYTVKYLAKLPENTKRFVMGHVISGSPIRNEKSKWYMSYELYPYNDYPPFASGTCYIMSNDVVLDTYVMSQRLRYLHLEDIFSALCWEKLGIVPRNHRGFKLYYVSYTYCHYTKLVSVHNVKINKMYDLWKKLNNDMARLSRYYCLFNGWFF